MGELRFYGAREPTRTDHLREIIGYSGWRTMDALEWKELDEFLFARAMEHDSPKLLFGLACEYLASAHLVRPRSGAASHRPGARAGSPIPSRPLPGNYRKRGSAMLARLSSL